MFKQMSMFEDVLSFQVVFKVVASKAGQMFAKT
jgi:hypothetical protein